MFLRHTGSSSHLSLALQSLSGIMKYVSVTLQGCLSLLRSGLEYVFLLLVNSHLLCHTFNLHLNPLLPSHIEFLTPCNPHPSSSWFGLSLIRTACKLEWCSLRYKHQLVTHHLKSSGSLRHCTNARIFNKVFWALRDLA